MTVDVDPLIEGGLLLWITGVDDLPYDCRAVRGSYRSGSCHEPSQSLGDRATQKGSWISPILRMLPRGDRGVPRRGVAW